MNVAERLKHSVLNRQDITVSQAVRLYQEPLPELCGAADEIRRRFCGQAFDLCAIVNAKSGRCSEDCKFCAQSAHYNTQCQSYPLLPEQDIRSDAEYHAAKGVLRYSLVTSGKTLGGGELETLCRIVRNITASVPIRICGSFGLLNTAQYTKLYQAGLTRIHNNLETSERFFPSVCATHTFADKVRAIRAAQKAGLSVCSGGIFGMGESVRDRIELAFSLKELGITSVPVNILNPVKGTPYEANVPLSEEDVCRIAAVYRFILPDAFIRLAGGRGLLADKGRACFQSGANAVITGDMLTTAGVSIASDTAMIKDLGFTAVQTHA